MKYILAIVASVFVFTYAKKSHMFSMQKMKSLGNMIKTYIPAMKYGKAMRAYK